MSKFLGRGTLMVSALVLGAMVGGANPATAESRLQVVASFSILGDMVTQLGGERVAVDTLVGAGEDMHVYQPAPATARRLATAELVVVNGLGFEGWLERLVTASGYAGPVIVATDGADLIRTAAWHDDDHHDAGDLMEHHADHDDDEHHDDVEHHDDDEHHAEHDDDEHHAEAHDDDEHHDDEMHDEVHGDDDEHEYVAHVEHQHGDYDPHAWQSLANGQVYARNIAAGLIAVDPAGREYYTQRLDRYLRELAEVERGLREQLRAIPAARRKVVSSHDAFGYFERDYGIEFRALQGLGTDREPSAAELARLVDYVRREGIAAVFMESITDSRLMQQVERETGARIGGTLYSDSLSAPAGPAGTYLDMMRHNIRVIAAALSS